MAASTLRTADYLNARGDLRIRTAIVSVARKEGLVTEYDHEKEMVVPGIATVMRLCGVNMLSTGGTYKKLEELGGGTDLVQISEFAKPAKAVALLRKLGAGEAEIADVLATEEILDGRVKTLQLPVYAGLLADKTNPKHMETLARLGIAPIDVVICNLYRFLERQSIEEIDVGGVTLLRAAAKNYMNVLPVPSVEDYQAVIKELNTGKQVSLALRERLAAKTFRLTSAYDQAIGEWIAEKVRIRLEKPVTVMIQNMQITGHP